MKDIKIYLSPTETIDCDNNTVINYAKSAVRDAEGDIQKAVRLYYKVRDDILYDPYSPFFLPEHYKASNIIKIKRSFCIPKAVLLCAVGRAVGIPTRLRFANVKNHLSTKALLEYLGSDLFVYHGLTEFLLNERWVKATPAFNSKLCTKFGIRPLEFDGIHDSVFQQHNIDKKEFMEYMTDHGAYADLPLGKILSAWRNEYGKRVDNWIELIKKGKKTNGKPMITGSRYQEVDFE